MKRNIAASVRARLANKARETGRPFQEALQYFGLERSLYRLSRSEYCEQFLLKGALMLRVWGTPDSRPTRDIDLLGFVHNDVENLISIVRAVFAAEVEDDGLRFDASSIIGNRIKEDADYEGVRIKLFGFLENARIPIQLDIGFGDVVHPAPEERDYPTLLDFPAPRLRTYPRETVIAEKLEAIVFLGELNSRMKDFFDLWILARKHAFLGLELARAIEKTFQNRGTQIVADPVGLAPAFVSAEATQRQWNAFVRRSLLQHAPPTLEGVGVLLREFLLPPVKAVAEDRPFPHQWRPGGPWLVERATDI